MLRLVINNEVVDLGEKSSILINEESPVFEKDTIPGGFSFPFELPASPRNRRIFSHPDRIQANGRGGQDFPFHLYIYGGLIGIGTATINKASQTAFTAFLKIGTGDLAGKIEGKKLSDVDWGGQRPWTFKPEFTFPEDDFALFPIYNPNFMDGTGYEGTWQGNKFRLNSYENGDWFNNPGSTMAISPFPFLAYAVKRVFNHFGFVLKENVLATDPDLKKLVIYTNRDISTYEEAVSYRELYYQGYNGMMSRTVPVTTITRVFDNWDLKDCLPDILIKDFILSIRNLFNLAIIIDLQGFVSILKRKDLILSGKALPLTSKAIGKPQITPPDSFSGIKLHWEHDQSDLLFSEGFKDIFQNEALLKEPVAGMEQLADISPTINEIRLVRSLGLYYQYSGEEVDQVMEYSWRVYSNDLQDYKEGENPEELSSKASTLPMIHYQRVLGGSFIRCPQAAQLSNSIIRKEKTPYSLRFLFYHGMMADSNDTLYPYGSSDALDKKGDILPGANLSLRWDGETGLYRQLWKDYLIWWKNRKEVKWMITDPSQLGFSKKYEIDGNHYILKTRNIILGNDGIEPGECEFVLV